ncbi:hypothetical protein N9Z85_07460, partial [Akkermansiaceae bacterium]|nr:hypothetical protein [Akkermansiaceae bacterium]
NLNIEPWLEGFSVLEAPANYVSTAESSHIAYQFQNQIDLSLELKLADPNEVDILRRSFSVAPSPDENPDEVCIQFGIGSPPVSASAVVLERSVSLEPNDFEEVYRYEIMGNTEVLGTDIRSDAMPYYFTIFDQMMPAGRAFYRVRVLE